MTAASFYNDYDFHAARLRAGRAALMSTASVRSEASINTCVSHALAEIFPNSLSQV
jgi:hypothetical protein